MPQVLASRLAASCAFQERITGGEVCQSREGLSAAACFFQWGERGGVTGFPDRRHITNGSSTAGHPFSQETVFSGRCEVNYREA